MSKRTKPSNDITPPSTKKTSVSLSPEKCKAVNDGLVPSGKKLKQTVSLSPAAGAVAVLAADTSEISPSPAAGTAAVLAAETSEIPSPAAGTESNGRANLKIERPMLPSEEEMVSANTEEIMKNVLHWCEQELLAAIKKCPDMAGMHEKPFWKNSALSIADGEVTDGSLRGHKEPFDKNQCKNAIGTKKMYEASTNIAWLSPVPKEKMRCR